ncbi:type IV toxin-antitoxin system YeeU family antitoxin [Escherichia coli]|nr:type IV toxin-antitoxin system YeeU family antitoxin [Escherichia coli]
MTPCFGARLVQEGNQLHYLADRAGIRGQFSDADAYHLDQAFPLLMKQLELMLTSGELNPRHQHTVTLYARGLTCEADTGTRNHLITPNISPLALPVTENLR